MEGDGPDAFDYDALEARAFRFGDFSQLTVLRSLEVEVMHFDSDPAWFVTQLVEAPTVEVFLERGCGAWVPEKVVADARAYLGSIRVPGTSTLLTIDVSDLLDAKADTRATARPIGWTILVDESGVPHPGPPGPRYAGIEDIRPECDRPTVVRRLVTPGRHAVRLSLVVERIAEGGGGAEVASTNTTLEVDVARGEHRRLRCSFDRASGSVTVAHTTSDKSLESEVDR